MSIAQKYEEAKRWLIVAIVEKLLNRVPDDTELILNIQAVHYPNGTSEFFWKKRKILETGLQETENGIGGYFSVPSQYNDEFITEKTKNWMI